MSEVDLSEYESDSAGWYELPGVEKKVRKDDVLEWLAEQSSDEDDEEEGGGVSLDLRSFARGERDDQIAKVQALLTATRMWSLQPDGWLGPLTEQAIEECQEHFGLERTGTVTLQLWRFLLDA